ncbi:MAG: hypothetical protein JJV93_00040 [Alphaproteobacteria bacterium]|nr:hypothetical protein [Alphaproteobacteria bacterium]
MKFKLLFYGDLKTNPKHRNIYIHSLRTFIHYQLVELMKQSPWSRLVDHQGANPKKSPSISKTVHGIEFHSLITKGMKFLAELDINLLHPSIAGTKHADLDNRLKSLLDALKAPTLDNEVPADAFKDKNKMYTLLEDDSLVSRININTSHLLTHDIFDQNPAVVFGHDNNINNNIFMIIDVKLRIREGTVENLPFMV